MFGVSTVFVSVLIDWRASWSVQSNCTISVSFFLFFESIVNVYLRWSLEYLIKRKFSQWHQIIILWGIHQWQDWKQLKIVMSECLIIQFIWKWPKFVCTMTFIPDTNGCFQLIYDSWYLWPSLAQASNIIIMTCYPVGSFWIASHIFLRPKMIYFCKIVNWYFLQHAKVTNMIHIYDLSYMLITTIRLKIWIWGINKYGEQ